MEKRNKNIDNIIKEKLQDFRVFHPGADWSSMKKYMQENATNDIDIVVKKKMEDVKIYHEATNWKAFQAKRNIYRRRQNEMVMARAIEALLLLLIIWTGNRLYWDSKLPNPTKEIAGLEENVKKLENITNIHAAKCPIGDYISGDRDNLAFSANRYTTEEIGIRLNNGAINKSPLNHQSELISELIQSGRDIASEIVTMKKPNGNTAPLGYTEAGEQEQDTPLENLNTYQYPSNSEKVSIPQGSNKSDSTKQVPIHDAKKGEESDILDIKPELILPPEEDLHLDLVQKPKNLLVSVGIINGLNKITIPTSFLTEYNTPVQKTHQENVDNPPAHKPSAHEAGPIQIHRYHYSLGLMTKCMIHHESYRLAVGLNYFSIQYGEKISEKSGNRIDGYVLNNLTKVKSYFLEVPLTIEKQIYNSRRQSVYLSGGMNLWIGLKNNYIIETFHIPLSQVNKFIPTKPNPISFNDREFSEGVFQGGSTRSNALMNYTLGINYNYKISPSAYIFSSINYSAPLGDQVYGPYSGRFSQFNNAIGLIYAIR